MNKITLETNLLRLRKVEKTDETAEFTKTEKQKLSKLGRGVTVYAQATEPTDKEIGDIWIQTSTT